MSPLLKQVVALKPVKRLIDHEDARLGVAVAWLVGGPVLTLAGFYFMTVAGSEHKVDLQYPDIQRGFIGAAIGAAVGIIMATLVTIFYPKAVEADAHQSH